MRTHVAWVAPTRHRALWILGLLAALMISGCNDPAPDSGDAGPAEPVADSRDDEHDSGEKAPRDAAAPDALEDQEEAEAGEESRPELPELALACPDDLEMGESPVEITWEFDEEHGSLTVTTDDGFEEKFEAPGTITARFAEPGPRVVEFTWEADGHTPRTKSCPVAVAYNPDVAALEVLEPWFAELDEFTDGLEQAGGSDPNDPETCSQALDYVNTYGDGLFPAPNEAGITTASVESYLEELRTGFEGCSDPPDCPEPDADDSFEAESERLACEDQQWHEETASSQAIAQAGELHREWQRSYSGVVLDSLEPPETPTAICNDGTVSYSDHRQGTCSWHGGVDIWVDRPPV